MRTLRSILSAAAAATMLSAVLVQPAHAQSNPTPAPALPATAQCAQCQVEFIGQTRWDKGATDISQRDKYWNGQLDTATGGMFGEVNSDGWGVGADGWTEGEVATMRHYIATREALENVTYTIEAVQGATFQSIDDDKKWSNPAAGQLQGNGYKNKVEGVTAELSADGKTITVTIAYMPAMSSFSLEARTQKDQTLDSIYVNHHALGTQIDCVQYGKTAEVIPADTSEQPHPGPAKDGDTVRYTVTLTNPHSRPAEADFVDELADVLDDAPQHVRGDSIVSNGFEGTPVVQARGEQMNITGVIPANGTATVTYEVVVREGGNGKLVNSLHPVYGMQLERCNPAVSVTTEVEEPRIPIIPIPVPVPAPGTSTPDVPAQEVTAQPTTTSAVPTKGVQRGMLANTGVSSMAAVAALAALLVAAGAGVVILRRRSK
ncbi:LPXTG cell wall anchor domain-containing protein [Corynebacterium sp. 35RC1]|nr:LPXTG cell wall anchor domain-containing protein [Corynebacterium sp. 35RC1]